MIYCTIEELVKIPSKSLMNDEEKYEKDFSCIIISPKYEVKML
jgi:hypothetical protein